MQTKIICFFGWDNSHFSETKKDIIAFLNTKNAQTPNMFFDNTTTTSICFMVILYNIQSCKTMYVISNINNVLKFTDINKIYKKHYISKVVS